MPWLDLPSGVVADDMLPVEVLELWGKLASHMQLPDPFCCGPIWGLSFHEVFTPGRRIFYAMDGGSLVLFTQVKFSSGLVAYLPLDDSWLFGMPLLGAGAPLLLADCLDELITDAQGGPIRLYISDVYVPSMLATALFQRFAGAFDFYRAEGWIQASASLRGGYDGWLGRRSANTRAKLRQAQKRARRAGISFERWRPDPDQADGIYERMLAVEEASWKGHGHCGMAESPAREFYQVMLRRLAREGNALVTFAQQDDKDIGFIFGGLAGKVYRGQQFSYDAEAAKYSVGNLLQADCVQQLCDMDALRYDMGCINGERMGYKRHWTEQFLLLQTWRLDRKTGEVRR